jgi:hypothetical protein
MKNTPEKLRAIESLCDKGVVEEVFLAMKRLESADRLVLETPLQDITRIAPKAVSTQTAFEVIISASGITHLIFPN